MSISTTLPTITKPYINGHNRDHQQSPTPRNPQQRLDQLLSELAQRRAENTMLRNKLSSASRPSTIVYRAIADAHAILLAAATDGASTGRRYMEKECGLSRRRWQWAVGLLKLVSLIERNSDWRTGLVFVIEDTTEAFATFETHTRRLANSSGAYRMLRAIVHPANDKPATGPDSAS